MASAFDACQAVSWRVLIAGRSFAVFCC